jgi:hypothetical protein
MLETMEQRRLQRACEELAVTPFTRHAFTLKMLDIGLTPSWAAILLDMVMEGAIELIHYPDGLEGRTRRLEVSIYDQGESLLVSDKNNRYTDRCFVAPETTITDALNSVLDVFQLDPETRKIRTLIPESISVGTIGRIKVSEVCYRFATVLSDSEAESLYDRFEAIGYHWYD